MSAMLLAMALTACVERKITVVSQPEGALVYLNNQEIGRTPVTHEFIWYGNFDVQLRKDGYVPLRTHKWVIAPIWQWVPIDLLADVAPFRLTDHQIIGFIMQPAPAVQAADANVLLARATELKSKLESSENTRAPTTNPTTRPTTKPSTKPTTKPSTRHAH